MTQQSIIGATDRAIRDWYANTESIPTESELRDQYNKHYNAFKTLGYTLPSEPQDEVIERLVRKLLSELQVTKRIGFAYVDEDTKPWLNDVEDDIDWYYWRRYREHLIRRMKWSRRAVSTLDSDTKKILDLMANPRTNAGFERRGLVVASVQSGKTANYTGLVARAADAGYKIIIVLAGVHNVLRNQTQVRLEEGFTGRNIVSDQQSRRVGVGVDGDRFPVMCTSRDMDFNKGRASALKGSQTSQINEPVFFVVKKNSSVLKQVYEWLRDNAKKTDQLLLIDDEADNASINGKYKREHRKDEPTRINGQIRQILQLFDRKCYVGYTATPYANILIDPTVETELFGKDLFPSSFIYTLEESSDYFGARKVFEDYDEPNRTYLRTIDDVDVYLPPKHRSSFEVHGIPATLKEAIRTFYLATTLRYLNGESDEHSTMMVNVSPYQNPQRQIKFHVEQYCEELAHHIRLYAELEPAQARSVSPCLQALEETWRSEYASTVDYQWNQVLKALYQATKTIRVVAINTASNDYLDYEKQTEKVIAVGGYRLSRGLTLEGLVVSYYSRNAKAYDALMQMSRWFGYRPTYQELCRIWMSDQAAGWYKFIADSTDDLFDDLRTMAAAGRTPKDYGLKIQQSPDSLIVTARNKMGAGEKVEAPTNLDNGFVETIAFLRDDNIISKNHDAAEDFLHSIKPYRATNQQEVLYRHVPASHIRTLLLKYTNDDVKSSSSETTPILDYIDDRLRCEELTEWDVLVAQGNDKNTFPLADLLLHGEVRYPGDRSDEDTLVVGAKYRLGSQTQEKAGLTDDQITKAEEAFRKDHPKANYPGYIYRRRRQYPLLIIHPVVMRFANEKQMRAISDARRYWPSLEHEERAIGWGISFPKSKDKPKLVSYVFNRVMLESMRAEFEPEPSDDDTADD